MVQRLGSAGSVFDRQQKRLIERLAGRSMSELEDGTIVVVPSLSFPTSELLKIKAVLHYEERMLFTLLWLAQPELSLVYVTSMPLDPAIVSYYLGFLDDPDDARRRLTLVSADDSSIRGLSRKLLERRAVIDVIRAATLDPDSAYVLTFNVTSDEKELSEALELPLYGPHPDLWFWGSKSGSRRAAREAGVAVMPGREELWSLDEVESAIAELASETDAPGFVIKLNEGFSGQGTAILERASLASPLERSPVTFCAPGESWGSFAGKIEAEGAIVETVCRSPQLRSPSVQMRIPPGGDPEVVSTHDQILGGPQGQVYLGCRFPANDVYRSAILDAARRVGDVLASKGVVGPFGIDFLCEPDGDGYRIALSEINLRVGGTTHPFFMAKLATRAHYDASTGELVAGEARKHYVASDNLVSRSCVGLRPERLIELVAEAGLAFDRETGTGVALHLLGALQEHGKFGATCIGDSPQQADDLHRRLRELADRATLRK